MEILPRRKPRGLGSVYGERALPVEGKVVTGAMVWWMQAAVSIAVIHLLSGLIDD